MPRKLRKSVRGYLSKMKSTNSPLRFSSASFSSSKSWILKGCKHVKTLSFAGAVDNHRRQVQDVPAAATLDDVDQFLFDNFRSLYIREDDEDDQRQTQQLGNLSVVEPPPNRSIIRPVAASSSGSLADELPGRLSPTATHSTADVAAGSSSTTSSDTISTTAEDDVALPEDCIALLTYSTAPQEDFSRSMREMVESRIQDRRSVDWEFMEELLFGYLNLNEKKTHKFILSAFVDLIVSLRPPPSAADQRAPGRARRQRGNSPSSAR
ncbi:Transcription repressor OFP14 [Linum grandiflorum]